MKKLLLTLGTTAAIAAPLATAVACGKSSTPILEKFHPSFDANSKELTISRIPYFSASDIDTSSTKEEIKSFLNNFYDVIKNDEYKTSQKISWTKENDENQKDSVTISNIKFSVNTIAPTLVPINLDQVMSLNWLGVKNALIAGKTFDLTRNENIAWQVFSGGVTIIDDSDLQERFKYISVITNKTAAELIAAAEKNDPATTEQEADDKFGILSHWFERINYALGGVDSDWNFVEIDYNIANEKFKLTYNNKTEIDNKKEVLLSTISAADLNSILDALNETTLTSTVTREAAIAAGLKPIDSSGKIDALGLDENEINKIKNILTSKGTLLEAHFNPDFPKPPDGELQNRMQIYFYYPEERENLGFVKIVFADS